MSRINPGAAQLGPREPAHGSINSGIGDEICGVFQLLCDAQRRQYIFSLLRHRLERDHVGGVTTESALVSYNEGSAFSGGHTGDESPAPSWRPVAICAEMGMLSPGGIGDVPESRPGPGAITACIWDMARGTGCGPAARPHPCAVRVCRNWVLGMTRPGILCFGWRLHGGSLRSRLTFGAHGSHSVWLLRRQ